MYLPSLYEVTDPAVIDSFIRAYAFAILVSSDAEGTPTATHLPLELAVNEAGELGGRYLYGHVARPNPQWRTLRPEQTVLAIFHGPHAYVSPRWYDHPNVPTWNYLTVHAYGKLRLIEDGEELFELLRRLVNRYEANSDYRLETQPPHVIQQLKGVVGLEIKVERVEAKFKLSQNRNPADYANIIAQLRQRDEALSHGVAEAMAQWQHRPPQNSTATIR
jgi:transcriptional regulator